MEALMTYPDDRTRDPDVWLTPFLDVLGHKTRRIGAPLYLRGLLGLGERKSLQPMAAHRGTTSGGTSLPVRPGMTACWAALAKQADQFVVGWTRCC
jgi:SRSO17 transposase